MRPWIVVLILAGAALASGPARERCGPPQFLTGLEDTKFENTTPVSDRGPVRTLDDPISRTYVAGTTWYDTQQNGTMGKQIAVDSEGYVHVVWTNGLNNGSSQRHIYYNVWSPADSQFTLPDMENPSGVQVDASVRAGFANVVVNDAGIAFPGFHQTVSGTDAHAAFAYDFMARMGAFATSTPPQPPRNAQIIWPHMAIDQTGDVHAVMTESGGLSLDYYLRMHPVMNGEQCEDIAFPHAWLEWDSATFITMDVAASWHSDRIAVAWLDDPAAPEQSTQVMLKISEDGGLNWGEPINITQYPDIDTTCFARTGDIVACNQDTIRPWIDCAVTFDANDNVHVAFSAWAWYFWWPLDSSRGPWNLTARPSNIWHWDMARQEFNIVAERWYGYNGALGTNMMMCHRPNFSVDTTNNNLYVTFQMYDTAQWNADGHLMADAYVTVSQDNGQTWAEATNVSQTDGGQDAEPPNSMVERDITVAQFVSGGAVHMLYMLDHDAGTAIAATPEGVPTLNPMIYQNVPVEQIPTTPIIDPLRALRFDSTGFPNIVSVDPPRTLTPGEFALFQNYPNPFNPTTNIQFDLASDQLVSLRVFDVLGREVAAPIANQRLGAGAHAVQFDAAGLASGVYFYRLETATMRQTMKMVLMK